MSKVIGIDLGTTHSAVAVIEGGESSILATAEGGRLCPSVVGFNRHGERLVGQVAKRQAVLNPENTVFSIKRLMGRRVDDPDVRQARRTMPYKIVGGAEGEARVYVPQMARSYAPPEISAMILGKLKADAEAYLGKPVQQAVITVPAYFNDSQRQATKVAGQIAGLEVLRIVNEPTAAALAYGLDQRSPQTVMVFDLGGGTLDVSILEVGDGVVEVRSTCGDTFLGGDDWDRRIIEYAVEMFKREQGIDLRADQQAMQRIREAAEKARIELSSVTETEINLPFIAVDAGGPRHLQVRLTRAWLEQLTRDLVQLCVGPFERALRDAELCVDQIDEVLLVGGATRMPMIQDLVRKLTHGKEPRQAVNPDEVVAAGAAVQAGVLSGEVREVLLLDVTPLTLGVETVGGVRTPLIERNTRIPVRKSEVFSTAVDWQPAVAVRVLQGERPMAADNTLLGQFTLAGIRPAPRGVPQIEVTFDLDANGILNVSARDRTTGAQQEISITASTNLSQEDVARMVREARQNEVADRKRKELVEARNAADTAIAAVQRALRERERAMPPGERSTVELTITELVVAKEGRDSARIWHLVERLRHGGGVRKV